MPVATTLLVALFWVQLSYNVDALVVKVGVIEAEGFTVVNRIRRSTAAEFTGFIPDIVEELGRRLNFIPDYRLVADGRYGAFEESTGLWTGLIGDVINGTVDFAAAPLTITAHRESHIDFSHEMLDVGLVGLIRRPERESLHASRGFGFFFGIFDAAVWCTALALFFITSVLLYFNYRRNPREAQARLVEHATASSGGPAASTTARSIAAAAASTADMSRHFSLAGCAFFTLSTGCFQGYEKAPKSLAGRCLSLTWWVFVSIFAATYVAGFLCALVASGASNDNAFAYLDARDQYKTDSHYFDSLTPLWITGGSTEALMRDSSEPLFQLLYNLSKTAAKKDPKLSQGVRNISQLVELVASSSHYLGIVESPIADYYAKKSNCHLVVAGTLLNERSYAMAFNQTDAGHALKNQVNEQLLNLRESGFIQQAYRKHFGGQLTACPTHQTDGANTNLDSTLALNLAGEELARMFRDSLPITMKTFCGVLVLYIIGVLIAATLSIVDVYIFSMTANSRHAQVLRNMPDDDRTFRTLSYSDEQARRQQQQQQQQSQSPPGHQPMPDELA